MKKKVSVLAALAAVLFLLTGLQSVSNAEGTQPVIRIVSPSAEAGGTVEVNVEIKDNPGILGATLQFSFPEQLTLVNAEAGDAFSALTMTKPGKFESPCRFVWDGQELSENDIRDGIILTLIFKVAESAFEDQSYDIDLSYKAGDIIDGDLNEVTADCLGGSVTIVSPKSEISVSGIESDKELIVVIDSQNSFPGSHLIMAAYSRTGKLLSYQIKTIDVTSGESRFQFSKQQDTVCRAFLTDNAYRPICPTVSFGSEVKFKVLFIDFDGTVLSQQSVAYGKSAEAPGDPKREGYTFIGWDNSFNNVTSDLTVTAKYEISAGVDRVISAENATAKPGDKQVTLSFSINNNPGILGMTLKLTYDETALTLVGAENGSAVKQILTMTKPGKLVSGGRFVWDGQEVTDEDIKDGNILILIFDISETAEAGSYPVELTYSDGDILDRDLNEIDLTIENAEIRVK